MGVCGEKNLVQVFGNHAIQIETVLMVYYALSIQSNWWMSPNDLANACIPSPASFPEATVASSLTRWAWARRSRPSVSSATCSMNTSCTGPSCSWCLCQRWFHGKGKFISGLQWWMLWSISATSAAGTWYVARSWRQRFLPYLQLFDQDQAIKQRLSSKYRTPNASASTVICDSCQDHWFSADSLINWVKQIRSFH